MTKWNVAIGSQINYGYNIQWRVHFPVPKRFFFYTDHKSSETKVVSQSRCVAFTLTILKTKKDNQFF